jgi:hypothetical protein
MSTTVSAAADLAGDPRYIACDGNMWPSHVLGRHPPSSTRTSHEHLRRLRSLRSSDNRHKLVVQ